MNNVVTTLALLFLIESSSFLQATRTFLRSRMGSKFGKIRLGTYELPAFEHLKKSRETYYGRIVVTTLILSFLNRIYSFLKIRRTTIKAWMSLI